MIPADILPLIPGCSQAQPPLVVQPLPGGRGCNLVLRIDSAEGRFVYRQRHPPVDRPGSAARTEWLCQMTAAVAGLAPRLLHAAPDCSWLLMDYIDAAPWSEQQLLCDDGVEQLGTRLAQLHSLAVPAGLPRLDAGGIAAGYLQQLKAADPLRVAQYLPLLSRVQELSRAIEGLAHRAVLNHGDLQVGNLLGPEPMLIDWEYAQLADPTYDIACLLAYYPGLASWQGHLLACAGLSNPADQAALALQLERFACLNQLWDAVNRLKAG